MEEKYIKLLLEGCLNLKRNDILFIHYNIINKSFIKKIIEYAKNIGIKDYYLDEENLDEVRSKLKNISLKEITEDIFSDKIWDDYALKNAAFLILDTEIPGIWDNIEEEKIAKYSLLKRASKKIYKEKQLNGLIPWCIANLSNEKWAKSLNMTQEELQSYIYNMCMIDKENPINEWKKFLNYQSTVVQKLNSLKIKKLKYENSLGTNLTIELNEKVNWSSAKENKWMVNMPSYEIFTSPRYDKTNGIVYSSRPLVYNGILINNFWLKFLNGKVVDFDAETGKKTLEQIINSDEYSSYLGECALVSYDSPISKTKKIFNSTLLDENASCHLALGSGFPDLIAEKNFQLLDQRKYGINISKNHVDFMIGTSDMKVIGITDTKEIPIIIEGNICI